VLARGDALTPEDLLLEAVDPPVATATMNGTLQETLERATAARVRAALEASGGQRTEAAHALGIDRTTLYRLMKRHRL
jgi:transcriptional regulator of acetoin/glycerol metabolism